MQSGCIRALLVVLALFTVIFAKAHACDLIKIGDGRLTYINRKPIVEADLNGHRLRLLLDTGAMMSVIRPNALAWLDARTNPRWGVIFTGAGGSVYAPLVRINNLTIGNVTFGATWAAAADIATEIDIDGLLGVNDMKQFDIDMDFQSGTITFYAVRTCADARPPWFEPSFMLAGVTTEASRPNTLLVPIEIENQRGMAVLDTGAMSSVLMQNMVRRMNLPPDSLESDPVVPIYGAGVAESTAHMHRFKSVVLGPVAVKDVFLRVLDAHSDTEPDGLLGQDVLADRRMWLSIATRRVYLTPRAGDRSAGGR